MDLLHSAGISHGELDPVRILVGDGHVALDDFTSADATDQQVWIDRDVAAVLVATSQRVGQRPGDRRRGQGVGQGARGRGAPGRATRGAARRDRRRARSISARASRNCATKLATATGAEEVKPLEITRLTWANIGILAGVLVALAIAIPSLEGVNWSSVQSEFENADLGLGASDCGALSARADGLGHRAHGVRQRRPAVHPDRLTQVACSFLNLITPNGIGGTALQLDYLHKQGVPAGFGWERHGAQHRGRGCDPRGLFLIAAAITATAVDTSSSSTDNASLWAIALVAAGIGIILWVPKVRGKVVPAVKRAASDIWSVLRTPKKAMQLFGGDLAGNLVYPALSASVCSPSTNDSTTHNSSSYRSAPGWWATSHRCRAASE